MKYILQFFCPTCGTESHRYGEKFEIETETICQGCGGNAEQWWTKEEIEE